MAFLNQTISPLHKVPNQYIVEHILHGLCYVYGYVILKYYEYNTIIAQQFATELYIAPLALSAVRL